MHPSSSPRSPSLSGRGCVIIRPVAPRALRGIGPFPAGEKKVARGGSRWWLRWPLQSACSTSPQAATRHGPRHGRPGRQSAPRAPGPALTTDTGPGGNPRRAEPQAAKPTYTYICNAVID
jgi:hypothetical protein